MIVFEFSYFLFALALLIIEVLIGFCVHDQVIRPYGGDVLVVMLIYCAVKAIVNTPVLKTAIAVLGLAFIIELLQYLNLVTLLGLQHNHAAKIIIGTSFSVADLGCYTLGIVLVLIIENISNHEPVIKK